MYTGTATLPFSINLSPNPTLKEFSYFPYSFLKVKSRLLKNAIVKLIFIGNKTPNCATVSSINENLQNQVSHGHVIGEKSFLFGMPACPGRSATHAQASVMNEVSVCMNTGTSGENFVN